MGIAGKELVSLVLELWNGFFERKVRDTQKGMVRYYRAQVTAAAQNGKITVKRPFDEVTLPISYVKSMENATVGRQVVVLVYGEDKNLANHMVTMYTDGTTAAP
nr:MAG TPA: hypothetical protein [Caudoviricetes sp.]